MRPARYITIAAAAKILDRPIADVAALAENHQIESHQQGDRVYVAVESVRDLYTRSNA